MLEETRRKYQLDAIGSLGEVGIEAARICSKLKPARADHFSPWGLRGTRTAWPLDSGDLNAFTDVVVFETPLFPEFARFFISHMVHNGVAGK